MPEPCPPWERPALRQAAGDTLRPGGFALTDRAAMVMDMRPGWRVLDVGCGLGATVGRLRARFGASAYGVDGAAAESGRRGHALDVVAARGDSLPFGSETFSAVFCECVLSLLPSASAGLLEWCRVLRPGGYLALSDLHAESRPSSEVFSCEARALPLPDVRREVELAGFDVLLVEDHSRMLTELAAKLVLAGEGGGTCASRRGMGYYLMVAGKKGRNNA